MCVLTQLCFPPQYDEHVISPKEFVHLAGKSTLKDWKRAIRMNGIMLRWASARASPPRWSASDRARCPSMAFLLVFKFLKMRHILNRRTDRVPCSAADPADRTCHGPAGMWSHSDVLARPPFPSCISHRSHQTQGCLGRGLGLSPGVGWCVRPLVPSWHSRSAC